MITAHLPAGYITARTFARTGPLILAGLAGGIFPDLDLLWFYFWDNRQLHHHHYWVHIPGFWLLVTVITVPILRYIRPALLPIFTVFLTAIGVHLCLDSIAGDVKWLWPISDQFYSIIKIKARWSHWILNFILHPVFLFEILIWLTAVYLYLRRKVDWNTQ